MNWAYLLTGIEGRISRQPFWIAFLAMVAIEVAAHFLMGKLGNSIVTLLLAYPQFAILAKRGHDRNVPTWVAGLFIAAATVVSLLDILGFFGPPTDPNTLFYVLGLPVGIAALVLVIDFGFRRGTIGPNRYGPDPLDKHP